MRSLITVTFQALYAPIFRLAAFALLAMIIGFGVLVSLPRGDYLGDFGCFVLSGLAMAKGWSPYAFDPSQLAPTFSWTGSPNLSPPVMLPVFSALAHLNPAVAFRIWYFVSLVLYGIGLVLLARRYGLIRKPWKVVWALGLSGLWATLALGQIYIPLALACIAAWLLIERRKFGAAGVIIGILIAIKPNFIVWPILLLLAGHAAVAVPALLSAALFSLAPAVIYGPRIYADWLSIFPSVTDFTAGTNASLAALFARLGMPSFGRPAALVLLIVLAFWSIKRRPLPAQVSAVALVASILASPVGWIGYTLLLLPLLISSEWGSALGVSGVLLLVPSQLVWRYSPLPCWYSTVFGTVYPLALILILYVALQPGKLSRAPTHLWHG
jgi:hypothetical protein